MGHGREIYFVSGVSGLGGMGWVLGVDTVGGVTGQHPPSLRPAPPGFHLREARRTNRLFLKGKGVHNAERWGKNGNPGQEHYPQVQK
jgi:hypothetical protein